MGGGVAASPTPYSVLRLNPLTLYKMNRSLNEKRPFLISGDGPKAGALAVTV